MQLPGTLHWGHYVVNDHSDKLPFAAVTAIVGACYQGDTDGKPVVIGAATDVDDQEGL